MRRGVRVAQVPPVPGQNVSRWSTLRHRLKASPGTRQVSWRGGDGGVISVNVMV